MTRLKSRLRLARTIVALLVIAGALAAILPGAAQQMKRAHAPKSADTTPAEQEEARAASHAQIIRENNFGVALMNRQQFEQALGKFQRSCILEPQSDVGCVNAEMCIRDRPKVVLSREDWTRWNDYGIGLFQQGDLIGAGGAFEKITQIVPDKDVYKRQPSAISVSEM